MSEVDTDAIHVACPAHGVRCGTPRRIFDLVSRESVPSPWGVETSELRIFACRETGFRFRLAPSNSRIVGYYEARYHQSMEGGHNLARALGAKRENEARIRYLQGFVSGGRVLDLGCSTGVMAEQLRGAGYEVEASDLSPYACERVRALLPGLPVYCGAIADYAGRLHGRFDAITMMDVIEHIPDVAEALRDLHLMLKPQGWLFLRTPTLSSPFYHAAEWSYRLSGHRYRRALLRAYHAEHLVFFDETSITRILHDFGFEVMDISPDPLLWSNFKAAEMQGDLLQNAVLAAVYFAGRVMRRGHGIRVMARRT